MIMGIHHVSLKCASTQDYRQARDFYLGVLGLSVRREWAEGVMIDTGGGLIEIFCNGAGERRKGAVRHFALQTDDVDEMAEKIKAAGYAVFIEPNDIVIPSEPPYPARMAFCIGPLGEEIELFQER